MEGIMPAIHGIRYGFLFHQLTDGLISCENRLEYGDCHLGFQSVGSTDICIQNLMQIYGRPGTVMLKVVIGNIRACFRISLCHSRKSLFRCFTLSIRWEGQFDLFR